MDLRPEDWQRAADTARRLAQQQKDLVLLGDMAEKIASFEQSAAEAKQRAEKANEDAERVKGDLDAENAKIAKAKQTSADILSAAQKKANEVQTAALAKADAIRAEAEKFADETRAKAIGDFNTARNASDAHLAQVKAEVAGKRRELEELDSRKANAAQELAAIEAKLSAAKGEIARLLGA